MPFCRKCGFEYNEGDEHCNKCGTKIESTGVSKEVCAEEKSLKPDTPSTSGGPVLYGSRLVTTPNPFSYQQKPPTPSGGRPTGITLIAAMDIVSGALTLIIAIILGGVAGAASVGLIPLRPGVSSLDALLVGAVGTIVVVAFGLIFLLLGYGLWKGKDWAWTWSVIFSVFGIITDFLGGAVFSVVIQALILFYLQEPHVKGYFGKAPSPTQQGRG